MPSVAQPETALGIIARTLATSAGSGRASDSMALVSLCEDRSVVDVRVVVLAAGGAGTTAPSRPALISGAWGSALPGRRHFKLCSRRPPRTRACSPRRVSSISLGELAGAYAHRGLARRTHPLHFPVLLVDVTYASLTPYHELRLPSALLDLTVHTIGAQSVDTACIHLVAGVWGRPRLPPFCNGVLYHHACFQTSSVLFCNLVLLPGCIGCSLLCSHQRLARAFQPAPPCLALPTVRSRVRPARRRRSSARVA
ncbi:hypothetical protein BV25DRAFT_1819565 [Artomyces pyxidatus]|uniref:Uncharacterized protein n=1 Tax=Artomyces pyxidatus TaxID=48021 RepID=A0ACB8TFQ3_9AGAM|nr:hypothetical protein BV25DRAFT_1819565 [Artomyces pyxidatus]